METLWMISITSSSTFLREPATYSFRVQTVPVTGAVIVTTPQEVAIVDAIKAMNMFMIPNINVPILGIVENMSWFTPAELPDNKYYIFGEGGGAKLGQNGQYRVTGSITYCAEYPRGRRQRRTDHHAGGFIYPRELHQYRPQSCSPDVSPK